jgi:hypothetical protein
MQISINNDKPWLSQLKSFENELIKHALLDARGNQAQASRTLGIDTSTLRKRIKRTSYLKQILESNVKEVKKEVSPKSIIADFILGYTIKDISTKISKAQSSIMDILSKELTRKVCKQILETNEREKNMINTEEILEKHRLLLAEICEKVRENKELSEEHVVYARILFSNGFMTEKGEITEEGKDALYH